MYRRQVFMVPLIAALAGLTLFSQAGCTARKSRSGSPEDSSGRAPAIGVFVPGVMSGSPIYEMLAQGVRRAAAEQEGVEVTVVEGGFNQAEWEPKLTAMTAGKSYDLIVSSNPSLPAIVKIVSAKFPDQRFLLLDGELAGNPRVYSLRYNQREQSYLAGHIAALEAAELSGGAAVRIGLVAGQEYPAMNGVILPGYEEGGRAAVPECTVDFRVVGNWFDASKAAELAADMIRNGVKVILCVAGGANEGVVQTAWETGAKVVWFDTNGYAVRPGTVVGSAVLHQERAAYEKTRAFLQGVLPFGSAELTGVAGGYVDFIEDDPIYIDTVSPEIREKQAVLTAQIRSGSILLPE
jgi:simple sugar transport system substrate-binding protein